MTGFPFTAVIAADEPKLALVLAAIDPGIGGVLLRGEKGSAKTTLARGIAALLPGGAPFVDLPVGATEDRLVGSLDVTAALRGGDMRFRPGLLADADGGVLYVDEVNLLPDHLVDALLDVAASGVNRVEREGIAHAHPARFMLIGSMNPEEGELRPQFLDRFGLAASVGAPADPRVRAQAVRRRLDFDADRVAFASVWAAEERALSTQLAAAVRAGPAVVPPELIESVSSLCVAVGAEGLRADLVICRAAAALARWEGRDEATATDVRSVAPLALAHRARRNPLDPHGIDGGRLEEALADALGDDGATRPTVGHGGASGQQPDLGEAPVERRPVDGRAADSGQVDCGVPAAGRDHVVAPGPASVVARLEAPSPGTPEIQRASGRRSIAEGVRGHLIGDRSPGPFGPTSVAVAATVRAAATRRIADPAGPLVAPDDLREVVREQRVGNLIIIAVDASGSMGAVRRMEAVKGAVLGLLIDAYQRRDRVALVTFRDDRAEIVLQPTGSVEVARARLSDLPTGGRTPLAAGILAALELALAPLAATYRPLIVLLTDGRATAASEGRDPLDTARDAALLVRRRQVPAVVIDAEEGPTRLGLASELAAAMGARLVSLPELTSAGVASALRDAVRAIGS